MTQDKQPITEDLESSVYAGECRPQLAFWFKGWRGNDDNFDKQFEDLQKIHQQILEGQKALEELPKLKDGIKASKDVIDILWKQKQEVMNYAEQLKRTHQPIAESLAKILGIELNYD